MRRLRSKGEACRAVAMVTRVRKVVGSVVTCSGVGGASFWLDERKSEKEMRTARAERVQVEMRVGRMGMR